MLDVNKDFLYFTAYFLLHLLIAWRLWQYLERPVSRKIMLGGLSVGFMAMTLQLGLPGAIWQGAALLSGTLLPLEILLHRLLKEKHHKALILGFFLAVLAFTGYGLYRGRALPRVIRSEAHLKEWSAPRPHRLVQISDLHLRTGDGQRLRRIVAAVNGLDADWVVLSGDMSVGDEWPNELAEEFLRLQARHGVFAVRGNHEVRPGGVQAFLDFCRRAGIRPLVNQTVETAGLVIAGVDEILLKPGRKKERREWNLPGGNLELTLAGINPNRPILLLAHRSKWAYQTERKGVDLMLCGHSHGGQLPPLSWLVAALDPFSKGEYRIGAMNLSVSEGAGVWDYLPLRLFTANSIHVIEIIPGVGE